MGSSQTFAADKENLAAIRDHVAYSGARLGVDEDVLYDMVASVDEAATNIIVHGYKGKPGEIDVEVKMVDRQFMVTLSDRAPVFDPTLLETPDTTLPLEKRKPGGLGVYMMKHYMDRVEHHDRKGGGNVLILARNV